MPCYIGVFHSVHVLCEILLSTLFSVLSILLPSLGSLLSVLCRSLPCSLVSLLSAQFPSSYPRHAHSKGRMPEDGTLDLSKGLPQKKVFKTRHHSLAKVLPSGQVGPLAYHSRQPITF
jgi:hypothetical protein